MRTTAAAATSLHGVRTGDGVRTGRCYKALMIGRRRDKKSNEREEKRRRRRRMTRSASGKVPGHGVVTRKRKRKTEIDRDRQR